MPDTRTLALTNPMMHGSDVTAAQTLLTAKGFPCMVDGVFGPETAARCVEAKTRLGYVRTNRLPTCGPALIAALTAHAPFTPKPVKSKRQAFVAELRRFNQQRIPTHYEQVRPMNLTNSDCSGSITLAAKAAGCPDPNGLGFNGQGYTGTMLSHCKHIPRSLLQPGDLAVFGAFPGHHVVAVVGTGADPDVFSHGHEGDPEIVPLSHQAAYQPATVTYLSFLP